MIMRRLREMVLEFMLIIAVTVICAVIFCTIFFHDVLFNISLLWQLLVLSFLCTLPGFVFLSKKELGKKQMRVRIILHLCILIGLLLSLAYYWEWMDTRSIIQPVVFIVLFALSYLLVWCFTYLRDKNVARMLNESLESYKKRAIK